jgi:signal transduction histidine kinase
MATFKARARALDMLGRQQIAGIPTAISELFKNAHDAYADRVEADYYRTDRLFVLRDDGLGMTEEEFVQRWLTLGTESKVVSKGMAPPPVDPSKPRRRLLGEKGVGRLAIAIVGPQVLVLTRAKRDEVLQDTVAAFIHWGLFECPGVDLDQIEIPIRTFPGGTLPNAADLRSMVRVFEDNLARLRNIMDDEVHDAFLADLRRFDLDPSMVDAYLPDMSLTGDGHGTHFLIKPASELLAADIEDGGSDRPSNLVKLLGGFSNTMTPGHKPPVLRSAFRDHKTEDMSDDLIEEGKFFTPEEFSNADHQIRGRFDEYGQFRGAVSVYGQEFPEHIVSWQGGHGSPTRCGPFGIQLAVVQGQSRASTLPLEDWNALNSKMFRFGGLYIYRTGVRILPYGNNDFDWLDIERNRTKGASYYYFSYRRMFGVVDIDSEANGALIEKAGREGFRENQAYREFKSILQNFFSQLTADFFRDDSPETRYFNTKTEFERQDKLRKKREEQVTVKKQKLQDELKTFFARYDVSEPRERVDEVIEGLKHELVYAASLDDPAEAAQTFLDMEEKARGGVAALEVRYKVTRPRGIGLPKNLTKDWESYVVASGELQETVFAPARKRIDELVGEHAARARVALDRRLQIERSLKVLSSEAQTTTSRERKATRESLDTMSKGVVDAAQSSAKRVKRTLDEVFAEFAALDVTDLSEVAVIATRERLETTLQTTRDKEIDFLQTIRGQIDAIDLTGEGGALDQMEAVEQRAIALEEQADVDLQLTQLGMAIEVINHEFDANIRAIRTNIRRLKSWADANPALEELYSGIRNSFEHLDGYLTLFTPLHRRLQRKEIVIRGRDIAKFIADLFTARFTRHKVELESTEAFRDMEIVGYPSTFYPVFVNLVDNAIFWLKDRPERRITLDSHDGRILVSDTGPGIPKRDRESVFELGFSRKPGGRGMGLYISRESLSRANYDLTIADSDTGTTFVIAPKQEEEP